MNFLSDGSRELGKRGKPTNGRDSGHGAKRGYPPVYHHRWFPVLDHHPDRTVDTLEGYIWVETPWKVQSMWAAHLEIADRPV